MSVWLAGGEACLNLTTSRGMAKVGFNCTLGFPGAPHSLLPPPPPSPPSPLHQPRHRGPAERERNRQRAARHQAAQKLATGPAPTVSSPSLVTASVNNISSSVTSEVFSSVKKCDQCDYSNDTEKGLNQHIRMKHKIAQIDGLEDSDLETPKKPDESKSKTDKVNVKEPEVLEDPSEVTVTVKEVSKIFKITVKESIKDRIDEELESLGNDNITEFRVQPEHNNFSVKVSCREFDKSFTASSAVGLLKSFPWPDGFNVTSSEPTTYLAKNP